MKQTINLKTYYIIILPAVALVGLVFFLPNFSFKVQFAFFIVAVSLLSLFLVTFFEAKGRVAEQQPPSTESVSEAVTETADSKVEEPEEFSEREATETVATEESFSEERKID